MTKIRPTRRLILDSGAFSVWTQGAEIDLKEYVDFCEKYPDCSYYVNLDVIPGKPGDKSTLTTESVEESCKRGWGNYLYMIDRLPKEKVIPVFHQGDPIKWLKKYLDEAQVEYIGISPANDRRTRGTNHKTTLRKVKTITTKLQWIESLHDYLFDSKGHQRVKTHGFAVTSYDLLNAMEWTSVDSASWKLAGAWGAIYVPRTDRHGNIFDVDPVQVRTSATPSTIKMGRERYAMKFTEHTLDWLAECEVEVGEFEIHTVKEGYKLNRENREIWFAKDKRLVLFPIVDGVTTAVEERLKVNAEFVRRANKAMKEQVKHIYFAGAHMPYPLEHELGNRLLSFYHTKGASTLKAFEKHLKLIRKG